MADDNNDQDFNFNKIDTTFDAGTYLENAAKKCRRRFDIPICPEVEYVEKPESFQVTQHKKYIKIQREFIVINKHTRLAENNLTRGNTLDALVATVKEQHKRGDLKTILAKLRKIQEEKQVRRLTSQMEQLLTTQDEKQVARLTTQMEKLSTN